MQNQENKRILRYAKSTKQKYIKANRNNDLLYI